MEAIHLEAVAYEIENKSVLRNISCKIPTGSFVALLGENGSGKTTLIELLMGFRKPSAGYVRVQGKEPHLDPCKVREQNVIGHLSAGEIRRAQIVGALSIKPQLILVDEITAVLDIVGRQKFFEILTALNQSLGCTIFMATNIMEGLATHLTHAMIIKDGRIAEFGTIASLVGAGRTTEEFSRLIAEKIENA